MSEKPTYEELEQRIRELESSAVDHENATTISIEQEQMFQHCFENANIGVCLTDPDGKFIMVNNRMVEIFGYNKKEFEDMNVDDVSHPEDIAISKEVQRRVKIGEIESTVFQKRYIHKKGHTFWGKVSNSIVKDHDRNPLYFVTHFVDVTEDKRTLDQFKKHQNELKSLVNERTKELSQTNEALRESEERLKTVIDQSPFPVAFADTNDEKIIYWSKSAIEMFGHNPNTVSQWYELAYPDPVYRKQVMNRWKPLLEKASISKKAINTGEYDIVCKDGTVKVCEIYAQFIPGNLVVTLNDITGPKQMEEALLADLKFFENIDKVNRAFQGTTDFEQMLSDVLDVVLTIFDCDRASLVFPCDPDTTSWSASMERTKPEWPGALTLGLEVPMDPEVARIFRVSRAADGPVEFGPGYKAQLPTKIAEQFNIQSQMTMALYPKTGQPWNFVLHQCSYPRVWTQEEKKLLTEIGRRMEDALTILLMYRNIRDSEKRLRRIIENTGAGYFFIDLDGNFQNVNASWLRMHGYISADEIIGRHFSVTQSETDLHQAKTIVEGLLSGKTTTADEFSRQNKDGSIGYHSFSANPVIKGGEIIGLEGFLINITERKQAETRLHESETKYRAMMESMDESTYICSSDFRIEYMNPAMIRKIGRDATGERCYKVLHGLDEHCPWCEHDKVIKGESIKTELFKPKEDEFYLVSHSPIFHTNGSVSKLSIYRDVTENRKLEHRIQQAQKMEAIGNLAGGIAHDFNNILSSIIGFTELALDEASKGTLLEDSLQEVYSAGKRAKELVKQILAFARQLDEKMSPIQPRVIVKEVLNFIRSTIPTTIEIQENIKSESLIFGNSTQVHQVLMNLCTNAAYAMEDSGGTLNLSLKDVFVDKEKLSIGMKPGDYVEIKVADTGTGIPPDIIDSIFEPYFTTKTPGEGTGIGLALVQGVVESYGGKITVDSQMGKGTTFAIYLPINKKRTDQEAYEPEELPTGTERILFVDDEAPIAKMGGQILERLGYSVTTRTSSIEAVKLFRAKPNDFDLIVTDMTMPNMTGDKLAVEVMKIRSDIPVILCTGYSKKLSDESAAEIGIKAFAYKPVIKADLAKIVRKVLNEAAG